MYRSDTKSRERNIGSYVTIHLILWRAMLTFLWRLTLLLIGGPAQKTPNFQMTPMPKKTDQNC
jgi:hypothetical protein